MQPLKLPPSQPSRASREEALWKDWHAGGRRPEHLRPLLKSLEPLVQQTVNKYRAADVAEPALRTHAENHLVKALHTYKPGKSGLSTHLNWQMRGVGRFVERHQNVARIPGSRIRFVGKYKSTQSALSDTLGRAPTLAEIAKQSKIPLKQVNRLSTELRATHISGLDVDETGASLDRPTHFLNADKERLELMYHELTPIEQQVVDYSLGRGGKKELRSTGAIARVLKVSDARISNVRSSIAKKLGKLDWIR